MICWSYGAFLFYYFKVSKNKFEIEKKKNLKKKKN